LQDIAINKQIAISVGLQMKTVIVRCEKKFQWTGEFQRRPRHARNSHSFRQGCGYRFEGIHMNDKDWAFIKGFAMGFFPALIATLAILLR
jgi:hypothetical protein